MNLKEKLKRTILLLGTVCLLCMTATACASESEADPAQGAQDAQAPVSDSAPNNAGSTQIPADEADNARMQMSNPDDAQEDSSTSGRWHVLDAETAKAIDADLEGSIRKIGQDSFFISVDETILDEDGGLTMATAASEEAVPESDLLQVIYDNNTRFSIRNIFDNGASYKDEEAASGSLEAGQSVSLKGMIENDIFYADEVRISIVK